LWPEDRAHRPGGCGDERGTMFIEALARLRYHIAILLKQPRGLPDARLCVALDIGPGSLYAYFAW
jgi:hypothetical protein